METDFVLEIVKVVFYSALVILLIYLLGLYLRRLSLFQPAGRRMEILERISMSRQQGLLLVRVDDSELLIGLTQEGMEVLSDLGARDEGTADHGEQG